MVVGLIIVLYVLRNEGRIRMERYKRRVQRIKELHDNEAERVQGCIVIKMEGRLPRYCISCDSFYICKQVFDEETEGGGD
jgi:hypothetical protein